MDAMTQPMPLAETTLAQQTALAQQMQQVFAHIWQQEMAAGDAVPVLMPDTVLLETGLDSMGFAIFVSELEEVLGYDPFAIAEDITVYPQTFAEFLVFYDTHRPAETGPAQIFRAAE